MTEPAKPLRHYQKKLVREVSDAYLVDKFRGVLMQSATGSGKTRTATYIVEKYASTGRQVLWLVHREELLMQAAMVFAEAGVKHRMICATSSERAIKAQEFRECGRSWVSSDANVVIASIQTLVRRLDAIPWLNPSQIVADECHLSLAATWRRVLDHWPEARLLGLTATPTRLDGQSFARTDGGIYDVLVKGPLVSELIEWGNLAPYKIFAPPIHFREGVKLHHKGGDWDAKDLEAELDTPVIYGDVVEHYRNLSEGKPAIAFCPTVATAEKFAQAFRDAGYRAIALDGQTDDAIRRKSLKQLGDGELDVVTSVSILVEGTDVPYATTALMLRRTESLALYLQAVGRVLRPHPKKEHAIILDFVGVTDIHGSPKEPREWTLDGRAPRSKSEANPDDKELVMLKCPKCFSKHEAAPYCPECGHEYPVKVRKEIEQVDGELQERTDEEMERIRRQRLTAQGKMQTIEEMIAAGYPAKQAEKIIQAREEKAALREQIIEGLMAHAKQHGGFVGQAFGVTLRDVKMVLKPKALKELLARVQSA